MEKYLRKKQSGLGDLNGHVGEENDGYEEIMGKHGVGSKNEADKRVKDFARENGMTIVNTFFGKKLWSRNSHKLKSTALLIDFCLCIDSIRYIKIYVHFE